MAFDEGSGPVTVIVSGGGLDDGRGYAGLAAQLRSTCRVLRLTRRRYRTDVGRSRAVEVKDEALDVVALAREAGRPCYLFGHSAGGVVALEAVLAAPECFDALAVYEPALDLTELPLGPPSSTLAARRAIDAGHPGQALEIFLRDIAGAPAPAAKVARLLALSPRFRRTLIPGQIGDAEALEQLGDRLDQYRGIAQHVLLVGGAKSPAHFGRRLEALDRVLPCSDLRVLGGAGHTGPVRRASHLAQLLTADIATHVAF
ncbi:alpha/beta fold hydrolase [Ornithinimicrobium sp. LYQ103]|uniref:alpha/beta fold hydrolase n=1 Tax=Ornithinimicrobium sp. LYQ103 TaxID=3378796 RepID=UPI003851B71F